MMRKCFTILFTLLAFASKAQKIESISFNLYTDSLKKGVHNYINVDGKMSNGHFYPLMADEVIFSSSAGKWDGNSIIIDPSYNKDSVVITAKLKKEPALEKTVTIYIKKFEKEEKLKTEQDILNEMQNKRGRKGFV
jgi:hypothetical protein